MEKIKQRILDLENELVPLLQKKFGKNAITLLASGSCANFDVVLGWSDYDVVVFVHDRKKIPAIDFRSLEKKYGIQPIQVAVKSWRSFLMRTLGNSNTDRFVDNLWLVSIRKHYRVLAGKKLIPFIPPMSELLKRDLGCELRAEYYHATNVNPDWNIAMSKSPKRWINCIISLSFLLLIAKGVAVQKKEIPAALAKHYSDFPGTGLVRKALAIRATGKIPSVNSPMGRQAKKLLIDFLQIYQTYLFRENLNKK